MPLDDETYYRERAEAELELAQRATHPAAVRIHYLLSELYLNRIHGGACCEEKLMWSKDAAR